MLNGNVFVFDNVVHMYDLSDDNLKRPESELDRHWHLKISAGRRPPGQEKASGIADGRDAFARKWTPEDLGRMMFEESSTDMAMAHAVPLFDVYKDGFAPVRSQYEFHKAFPDRTLFCGAVDPNYPSTAAACEEMERQVKEWGAVSFKFYNSHLEGKSWRCDDPKVAYPMYEKARALGVKVLQFHKGFPISRARLDALAPGDLHQAVMDFPDLTFAVHHLSLPFFEETVYLAAVFPNVHLVLSGTMHLPVIAPWEFKMYLGRLLRDVGSGRILWGSEAPLLGNPQPMIEWFWNMQIDEELQDRYGFPEITETDKRRILGENQARMFGVDVAESLHRIGGKP